MLEKVSSTLLAVVFTFITFSASRANAWEPLGYPYLTWGEISQSRVDRFKIDGYAEQGVDIIRVPHTPLVLNFFTGLRFTESDRHEDRWNNKIAPIIGTKLKMPIALPAGHWGQLDVGVRAEESFYYSSRDKDTFQVILFTRWGFGGDWKKK